MGMPSFPQGPFPDPVWAGVREMRLGDAWLARWVDESELPTAVPVSALYASVMMDGKGYLTRQKGTTTWQSIEAEAQPGESAELALKRVLKVRMAATPARIEVMGYLDCRATSFHPEVPAGSVSVQPIFLVVAKALSNMPSDSEWERRRLPLNEHIAAIRLRYPQFEGYFAKAVQRYAVMQARGEG